MFARASRPSLPTVPIGLSSSVTRVPGGKSRNATAASAGGGEEFSDEAVVDSRDVVDDGSAGEVVSAAGGCVSVDDVDAVEDVGSDEEDVPCDEEAVPCEFDGAPDDHCSVGGSVEGLLRYRWTSITAPMTASTTAAAMTNAQRGRRARSSFVLVVDGSREGGSADGATRGMIDSDSTTSTSGAGAVWPARRSVTSRVRSISGGAAAPDDASAGSETGSLDGAAGVPPRDADLSAVALADADLRADADEGPAASGRGGGTGRPTSWRSASAMTVSLVSAG